MPRRSPFFLRAPSSLPPMRPPGRIDPRAAREPGGVHVLRATTRIERRREEVFPFFADAGNLERITPPELRFEIVTPQPIEMRRGTLIEYRLRLWGARFGWQTEITDWSPPHAFTDSQVRGPYHTWIHRHDFEEERDVRGDKTGATIMTDEVRYRLPLWPLGEVALPLVAGQLRRIFRHRAAAMREILG